MRQQGNVRWSLWRLQPHFGLEAENRKDVIVDSVDGFKFYNFKFGSRFQLSKKALFSVTFNERTDKTRNDTGFVPKSTAFTQNYSFNLKNWRHLNTQINVTHRERNFSNGAQNTRSDLADMRLQFTPLRRALTTDFHYQITNTQLAKLEEIFLPVDEGQGNFRFDEDLNEFIPDPVFGDHIRRLLSTETFIPVVEVRVRNNFRVNFSKLFKDTKKSKIKDLWWQRLLQPVSSETFIRLEERTTESDVWEIYRLNLSRFQNDSTRFGIQSLRQDIHLWENKRNQSVRYRLTALRERNNQLLNGGSKRTKTQHELRMMAALSDKTRAQFELKFNRENRIFENSGSTNGRTNRMITSYDTELELSYRPRQALEFANAFGFISDRDRSRTPTLEALAFSLKPRVVYSIRRKGRLRGEIEWVNVRTNPGGQVLPFELAQGNREGTTLRWNFSFEYRVTSSVNFSASYLGRKEPDRSQTLHLGKMEMRAFF